MDLLKKIQYNQQLTKASDLLLQTLLTNDEVDEVTQRLNIILTECNDQHICRQAKSLLQQLGLRISAQNYAKFTAPFGNYFVGMSADPSQLQDCLFQHPERGWGILFKNYRLWQIWIKKDKNFIQSLWSDTLEELSIWLAEKFNEVMQAEIAQLEALELAAIQEAKASIGGSSSNTHDFNQEFTQEFNFGGSGSSAGTSAFSIPSTKPEPTASANSLAISPESIQLLASVLAEQLKDKSVDPKEIQQALVGTVPSLQAIQQDSTQPTSTSTLVQEIQLAQHIAAQQELMQQLKAKTQLEVQNAQKVTGAIPSTPLSDSLELNFEMDLEEKAPVPSHTQYSDTKTMRPVANDFSDVELNFNFEEKTTADDKPLAMPLKTSEGSPQIEIRMASARPKKESISNLMSRASSSTQNLTEAINRSIENQATQVEIQKAVPIEAWNCEFELNDVEGMSFYQIKLSQYIQHLNLLSCDIDMRKVQQSPIYVVETMDHQNHFKYYTFVFATENPRHAMDLINRIATKNQEQLAHVAEVSWKEFKNQAFELTQCCQLYHTSPVIVKASSLYSHIVESLISKQQMIVINEAPATKVTPLLLLQENHRFRVIHGQQRLALGSATRMYPCMILTRSSGVTWQMIREQLQFLPTQVGVYELLDALRYAADKDKK